MNKNNLLDSKNTYEKIIELFYDLNNLLHGDKEIQNIITILKKYNKFNIDINDTNHFLSLNEILIKNFKSGFKKETDDYCPSYGKLINLIYNIGNIIDYDMNGIVDTLDEITYLS